MKCPLAGLRRSSAITIVCLIFVLGMKNARAQPVQCYSCTDQGGGECLPEKALNVSCPPEYDACVEAVLAVRTSHSSHVVLKKGCGYGDITKLQKAILYNGMSIYIQLNHCKTGNFCNTDMDLKDYQLAPPHNDTCVPNGGQCYSCIGKPGEDCSPATAPIMQCYDSYTHCFDGRATISVGNDSILIPIKSCSMRYRCAVQCLTYGSTRFEIKGACCTRDLCNNDLSDKTQLADLPFLVLLNDHNEELTATVAPPLWLEATNITEETSATGGITKQRQAREVPKNATASNSTHVPLDRQTNVACQVAYLPCLLLILLVLS